MKMFKKSKEYFNFLKTLKDLNPEKRSSLMSYMNDKAIDDLCECVYNIIYTDLGFSKKTKNKIRNHIKNKCCKNRLKKITNKSVSISKRKKALMQEGGNIFMLIARALPFIANTISALTSKNE